MGKIIKPNLLLEVMANSHQNKLLHNILHWTLGKLLKNIKSLVLDTLQTLQIYPSSSPICWRCDHQLGTLYHTFWNCKNLSSFWNTISYCTFIASLTGNLILLTPATTLLGINLDIYPLIFRTVVANVLIAARLTIAKLWKSNTAPNLTDVILRLNTQAHYELMLAHKNFNTSKFKNIW